VAGARLSDFCCFICTCIRFIALTLQCYANTVANYTLKNSYDIGGLPAAVQAIVNR